MAAQDYGMPKDVVPPGDQTGVYYIPISNLPFTASWQQIKDYVRQVCDVDHVEIFQKSTSGWVRVNGRENFDAAFRHLNGKEFNGRAIFADGRNGENPMLVRDLKVCKPTGPPSNHPSSDGGSSEAADTASYATGGPVSYSDSSMYSSSTSTSTGSSSYSQVGLNSHSTPSSYSSSSRLQQQDLQPRQYQCRVAMPAANELMMPHRFEQNAYNMPMSASSYMTTPDMTFSQGLVTGYDSTAGGGFSHPNAYGYGSVQPAAQPQAFMSAAYPPSLADAVGPQSLYNATASYAVQPPTYLDYYPPAPTSSAATTAGALAMQMSTMALENGNSGGGDVIYTEQRGVHIRDISRRASEDQIRKLIREVTGPEAALIETIRVPKNEGGAPRGHAFVHLRSASLAWRLVEHLNGREFKGRKLQVRLMKEGDTICSGAGAVSAIAAASFSLAPASSSSSSSKQRVASKHHHHHHHHQHQHQHQHQSRSHHAAVSDRSSSRRTERKERDRPEKSNSASSANETMGSGSKACAGPLVVGTPVTAFAAAKEKQHGKKSVVIADGSSTGRRSG